MANEIIFIVDGKEVVTTIPAKEATTNVKLDDKGLYTLTTKNALKLSQHVQNTLGVKINDEVGFSVGKDMYDEKSIFIFKTNSEDGKKITKLGTNKSYVRLNYAELWNELKGNDKTTLKYELGTEVKSKDGKTTAYVLKFVSEQKKQASGKKTKPTGKAKGNVKQVDNIGVDNILQFDLHK